jgi:hypothetical protein
VIALRRTAAAAVVATLAVLATTPATALAADKVTAAACIEANEQAGPLRHAGKLREARASLRLCSAEACPIVVRKDCLAGAAQADADVPTITFSVQGPDGNDLTAVTVTLDGQPLVDRLDGKAVDVDPGEHVFRFEAAGLPPVEKHLVVTQGQKNRQERVQLGAMPAGATPGSVVDKPKPSSQRTTGIIVGGVGLGVGVAGVVAGLVATAEWSAAKTACGAKNFPATCANPAAASSDRSATVAASDVADIGIGLGAAALVTGIVMVVLAPPPDRGRPSTSGGLTVGPLVGGGAGGANGVLLQGSF